MIYYILKFDYGINLINKVDQFYNSAWEKLVIIGTVSFAVIGILVPFVIQWYQKKTLKSGEELLKIEMQNQLLILKAELLEDISNKLDEKLITFEKKFEEHNASTTAKAFHLQGNSQIVHERYAGALSDFSIAATRYFVCDEYSNLQVVLSAILENCLPKLSQEEIDELKISHNCDLEMTLNDLTEKDEKGAFRQLIRDIKLAISKLPKSKVVKVKA